MNPHFTALESAAYQLHYYLCFKTHYMKPKLAPSNAQQLTRSVLESVCERERYHLLQLEISPTHVRLLLSLTPKQTVSKAVRFLKGNLEREFKKTFKTDKLLGRGYFARTSGKASVEAARKYVDSQISHHGYKGEWTKPLKFRNPDFDSPAFSFEHCVCVLNYHLVFVTQSRLPLFDEAIGSGLLEYLIAIGIRHRFAVDRVGLLPDHMHMIIEGIPSVSVEDYALAIINNTRHWMEKNYFGVLKAMDGWDVWQPSYYACTVGEYTSAQVKAFLSS